MNNEKFYNYNNKIIINKILLYEISDFLPLSFFNCKNFVQNLIIKTSVIFL